MASCEDRSGDYAPSQPVPDNGGRVDYQALDLEVCRILNDGVGENEFLQSFRERLGVLNMNDPSACMQFVYEVSSVCS